MTFWEWADKHWLVFGWIATILAAAVAHVIHRIANHIGRATEKRSTAK